MYEEDPNALHNINIKANKIFENGGPGIALEFVNGVSISSNLIHSNSGDGILLISCPIVSITHNKILANEDGGITYFGDPDWPIVLVDTTEVEVELSLTISYNKIMGNGLDIGELIEGIISLLPFLSLEAGSPEETMLFNEVDPFMMKFGAGIFVAFAQNVVVTYNEIEGNSGVGLCLLGGFIMPGSASVAYSNFDEEVFLMEPVLVAYNTISGNTMAALMIGVSDVKILFNNIEGNIAGVLILGAGIFGNPIEGIQSEDILIKGNVLKDQLFALILIAFDAPVTIEWNTVTNNMVGIVLFDCESPQIIHNTIMYQRGFKLDLGALGIPFLLDLRYALTLGLAIDDTVISGYCDGARIAYNTIAYNVGHQVGIFDSYDVVVEHNTIIGGSVDGILAQESLDLTVQYNKITDNDQGIRWIDCSGLISNNIIGYSGSLSGNNVGINLTSIDDFSPVTISDNVIIGNNVSIFLINEDPTIVRNYIANNVYGIYLTSTSSPTIGGTPDNRNYIIRNYADGVYIADDASDPVINYNNIYWNIGFGINNWAATTDDNAEYNWWGEMDGPGGIGPGTGDEVTSGLDYIPWLTAPIP
ncbi:MAG: right-handed parallel beta-helix repeat-containing protein [archaeon]|nr:right-handed parallel beta-helix repeat-containing protein [archaeon]